MLKVLGLILRTVKMVQQKQKFSSVLKTKCSTSLEKVEAPLLL